MPAVAHCYPPPLLPATRTPNTLRRSNCIPIISYAFPALGTTRPRNLNSTIVAKAIDAGIGVLGDKYGMTSHFEPDGTFIPVTVIGFREGNAVTEIKTVATHGYSAVQVAYRRVKEKSLTKPELGHLKKAGIKPMRHLMEFRLLNVDGFHVGQQILYNEIFKEGDLVDISGITIGKGFQGVIKRHGFRRGPMSHGSKHHRRTGSIGFGAGRVHPGKKMPGKMGNDKRTIKKLRVVKIDPELQIMMVKGSVPGKPGNLLRITPAKIFRKKKKYILPSESSE